MTCLNYTLKICSSCKTNKPLSEFDKNKYKKDGLQTGCKLCQKENKKAYKRTKNGLISIIHTNQISHSRTRLHAAPNYSRSELREWALSQPIFHDLYDKWVASGYFIEKIPSFDRLNDYFPYSLDNLQIMTWRENNKKCGDDRKNGVNNKTSKSVIQMDLSGNFIKKHHSLSHAGRISGIGFKMISRCCLGKRKKTGGFKWRFANAS